MERLGRCFCKQYKYNMDIAPDRTSLSNLEKKEKESIREYAQRWRDTAAQVHPPLLDREMVTLSANTLIAPYYEHVMGSSTQQFTDAVAVAERIEQGIKSGRIPSPMEKKGFSGKRKEVDHIEGGYKGKNNQFPKCNPSPSQIANINFNSPFCTKKTRTTLEIFQKNKSDISPKRIIKNFENSYPHCRCP